MSIRPFRRSPSSSLHTEPESRPLPYCHSSKSEHWRVNRTGERGEECSSMTKHRFVLPTRLLTCASRHLHSYNPRRTNPVQLVLLFRKIKKSSTLEKKSAQHMHSRSEVAIQLTSGQPLRQDRCFPLFLFEFEARSL